MTDYPTHIKNAINLCKSNQFNAAIELLQHALQKNPNDIDAWHTWGDICIALKQYNDACICFNEIITRHPHAEFAYHRLIKLFSNQDMPEKAIHIAKTGQKHHPNSPIIAHMLGCIYQDFGNTSQSIYFFQQSLEKDALYFDTYDRLISMLPIKDLPPIKQRLSSYSGDTLSNADNKQRLFCLGKLCDRLDDTENAITYFTQANKCRDAHLGPFDRSRISINYSMLIQHITSSFFSKYRHFGNASQQPIFIIGMPRSGTSLIEQILASHPDIHGAGELPHIMQLLDYASSQLHSNELLTVLNQLDAPLIQDLAKKYMHHIHTINNANCLYITDKMPGNYEVLWFISLLFPNAHIIHCKRNALDTCLSCFMQNFTFGHQYKHNLSDLGWMYRQYQQLMQHWQTCIPNSIHTIHYEFLVTDPKKTITRLLNQFNLQWNDNCLNFQHTKRRVHTASNVQVRQKLYTHSVCKWKRYNSHLNALKKALISE